MLRPTLAHRTEALLRALALASLLQLVMASAAAACSNGNGFPV